MKPFKHLILISLIVALLIVIETIDAKKKEIKKKGIESKYETASKSLKSNKFKKIKKYENNKIDKLKKSSKYVVLNSGDKLNKAESARKGKVSNFKNEKNVKEKQKPQFTKKYPTVQRYKIIEDVPVQPCCATRTPKTHQIPEIVKQEVVDGGCKKTKKYLIKTTQKGKNVGNDLIYEYINEEFIAEENALNNQKKKKYKLVEVVLQEDDAATEGNETIVGVDMEDENDSEIQRTENEEIIEKCKTTQTLNMDKSRQSILHETGPCEDAAEVEVVNSDEYEHQKDTTESVLSDNMSINTNYDDLNLYELNSGDQIKEGVKKVALYVTEEEIDGQIEKHFISEEYGVTLCELEDLIKEQCSSSFKNAE